jgi:hypothetical protein
MVNSRNVRVEHDIVVPAIPEDGLTHIFARPEKEAGSMRPTCAQGIEFIRHGEHCRPI